MISKRTVDECLESYLCTKGFGSELREKIMDSLHNNVSKEIKKEKDNEKREKKKAKVKHGTSCPRIINNTGDLIAEF